MSTIEHLKVRSLDSESFFANRSYFSLSLNGLQSSPESLYIFLHSSPAKIKFRRWVKVGDLHTTVTTWTHVCVKEISTTVNTGKTKKTNIYGFHVGDLKCLSYAML